VKHIIIALAAFTIAALGEAWRGLRGRMRRKRIPGLSPYPDRVLAEVVSPSGRAKAMVYPHAIDVFRGRGGP
jgi:hypothetical protein